MARIWVIRAGQGNRLVDDFLAAGVVGLGFKEVGDATSLTREQIADQIRARLSKGIDGHVRRLWTFVHDVAPDDIVIMPDSPELLIGRVNGDYYFRGDIDGEAHRHRRPVSWTHRINATDLPPGHTDLYRRRQTLTERTDDTLAAFLARLESPTDDATGTNLIRTQTRRRRPAGTQPPKSVTPSRPVRPHRNCEVCGLSKAPSQFDGQSLTCHDCQQ